MDHSNSAKQKSASIVPRRRRRILERILNNEEWADVISRASLLSALKSEDATVIQSNRSSELESGSILRSKTGVSYGARVVQAVEEMQECIENTQEVSRAFKM